MVPAGNVVSTANEMSRFYQLLLAGGTLDGVTVFEPRTIRHAVHGAVVPRVRPHPGAAAALRHGLHAGRQDVQPLRARHRRRFGHLGFTNIICWADPERQISGALMTSGKPVIYPELPRRYYWVMQRIASEVPKTRSPAWLVR